MTSIHPRVVNGKERHPVVNTAKPPKKPLGGNLRKMIAKYDARQRDYQATLARIEVSQRAGFRRPGSMRLDKN